MGSSSIQNSPAGSGEWRRIGLEVRGPTAASPHTHTHSVGLAALSWRRCWGESLSKYLATWLVGPGKGMASFLTPGQAGVWGRAPSAACPCPPLGTKSALA